MRIKSDFADKVLETYLKLRAEISPDASEYDVRHRIIKYLVEEILGYRGKDYQAEKDRTDIKLLDETHSFVLVVKSGRTKHLVILMHSPSLLF